MTGAQRGSRVVFVGNIPYDMSEEQLIDVFREVGTVVGFRLVFDRETGKPKGYGFCEFEDAETAASAVRNLNNKELAGRPMRIDWADVDPIFEGRTTSMGQVDGEDGIGSGRGAPGGGGRQASGGGQRPLPPNLPQGQPLLPGVGATDAISQTLAALPPNQLLDILAQMKLLVTTAPEQAKTLLSGHPQLSYALFQAMLMMNVVDVNILQQILTSSGALGGGGAAIVNANASDAGPPSQHPGEVPPMAFANPSQPMLQHQQQHQQMPYGMPPPYAGGQPMAPPMQHPMAGAPPPPPPPAMHNNLPDDQKALLDQVLRLTPEEINALPPDQREGIMQLKASLGYA